MPLPAGVFFDSSLPKDSWPPTNPVSVMAPPVGAGRSPRARVAGDKTRWCAYGNHTLDPDSKADRCLACKDFRDRTRKRGYFDDYVTLPAPVVEALVQHLEAHRDATERLQARVAIGTTPTVAELEDLHKAAAYLNSIGQIIIEYAAPNQTDFMG